MLQDDDLRWEAIKQLQVDERPFTDTSLQALYLNGLVSIDAASVKWIIKPTLKLQTTISA